MDTTLLLDALRRAHLADPDPDAPIRIDRLRRLETALQAWEPRLVAAMHADFGHRSAAESGLFDITLPIADIRFARRSLRRWMRLRNYSKGVSMRLSLLPQSTRQSSKCCYVRPALI